MAGKPTDTKKAAKSAVVARSEETQLVEELAHILKDTELTEIEMKKGDLKIRVSRQSGQTFQVSNAAMPAAMAAPAAAAASTAKAAGEPASDVSVPQDYSTHPGVVKSPMVGTAYVRPSPDAEPFVKIGDSVKEGDTILLVEAMKTFNPIMAERSGKVEAILVDDAQPVEFGEPLCIIA